VAYDTVAGGAGVTGLEGADAGPMRMALVAVTVNVCPCSWRAREWMPTGGGPDRHDRDVAWARDADSRTQAGRLTTDERIRNAPPGTGKDANKRFA
jgi:hypothetical protein